LFLYLYRNSGGITPALLQRVIQASPIYGERQCWVSPDGCRGAVWSLGCLATAEGGTLPRADEPFALAVGRLDRTAGLSGASLRQKTDSERIAAHAIHAGKAGIPDLYGDFALACVSGKQLCIATDHLGKGPLFYWRTAESYAASTDLVALLSLPDTPKAIDEEGLALLALVYIAHGTGGTSFREIKALPGGHTLLLGTDSHTPLVPERWWKPPAKPTLNYRDPRDYQAELNPLFENAVRSRLPEQGPVGATLSGGLDSTLVVAFAAELLAEQGRALHCWTSVPHPALTPEKRSNWDSSDWPYASELADRYPNVRHEPVSPEGVCLLDVLADVNVHSAAVVRNSANHFWMLAIARRAKESGCQAVLTGERGNASVSYAGNGGLAQLMLQGRWLRSTQHILRLPGGRGRQLVGGILAVAIGERRTRDLRASLNRGRLSGVNSILPLMRPFVRDLYASLGPHHQPIASAEDRWKFATKPRPSFAANIQAHAAVAWDDPTADRQVIEYLLDCPPDAFLDHGFERLQARMLGAGRVPDSIRWRRTRGEQSPEEAGVFMLYPDRYRAAWAEARQLPWFAKYAEVEAVDAVLQSLLAGEPTERLTASTMHRLLHIGTFIKHAGREWPIQDRSRAVTAPLG
jgi:asparagine synthase (glutamine-hydrolysing)